MNRTVHLTHWFCAVQARWQAAPQQGSRRLVEPRPGTLKVRRRTRQELQGRQDDNVEEDGGDRHEPGAAPQVPDVVVEGVLVQQRITQSPPPRPRDAKLLPARRPAGIATQFTTAISKTLRCHWTTPRRHCWRAVCLAPQMCAHQHGRCQ